MIYYFTGTGNSRYAAEKLAVLTKDKCVSITKIFNGTVKSVPGRTDVTGFVFPVYFSGLPEIVKRFASHPEMKRGCGEYVYTVITCGAEAAAAELQLAKALGRKVDFGVPLKMPDNYCIAYEPSTGEQAKEILKAADSKLEKIAQVVNKKASMSNINKKKKMLTKVMYPFYNKFRITSFFHADDNCNGCGACVKYCPEAAIEIRNGKPIWVKRKCQHCTACINRCPQQAIQFGSKTKKRGRYYIMNINKKSTED